MSENNNLYEQALRRELTYPSTVGLISTQDLWRLPLTDTGKSSNSKPNLDAIGIAIQKKLSDFGQATSLVKKNAKTKEQEDLELALEVVKHIISVKMAEAEAIAVSAAKKDQLNYINSVIADKEKADLQNRPVEELKQIAESLKS
jgi:hypothetical protein